MKNNKKSVTCSIFYTVSNSQTFFMTETSLSDTVLTNVFVPVLGDYNKWY